MRGFGFWGSHPGLRRNLCVLLTIGLIVGSFTCFINADEYEEDEQETAVEQVEVEEIEEVEVEEVEEQEESKEGETVVEEATEDEVFEESSDETVEDQQIVVDEEDQNLAEDQVEEITESQAVEDNAEVEAQSEEDNVDIVLDEIVAEISVSADMASETYTKKAIVWVPDVNGQSWVEEDTDLAVNYFKNVKGMEVVKKKDGVMTAEELNGVDIVLLCCWYTSPSSERGKQVLGSSAVLKTFVEQGGKLLLNSENCNSWNVGHTIMEQIASDIGFDFSFSGTIDGGNFSYNTEERPELAAGLNGFGASYGSEIVTSDPEAVWIVKDNQGYIWVIDRPIGNGTIIVISDINWTDGGSNAAKNFAQNIADYNPTVAHIHIFDYSASGSVITAKCSDSCEDYADGVTLTIAAPEKTVTDDAKSETATLSGLDDFNAATGLKITEGDILYSGTGSTTYAESSSAPTAAGTYKASITAGGATASVEYEIEPVTYSFDTTALSWTKESTETASFRASRNSNDDTTIDHFTGAKVDNKTVEKANMNVTKGSVIVELKADFLNTLDVGTHTITFSFDDGDDISMSFTVKAAPKASPQTGEYSSPAVLVMAAVLLAGSAVAGVKVFKKKEEC